MSDNQKRNKKRISNPVLPPDRTWQCNNCTWILGYLNHEKTQVRIKFKDLFVFVEGGKITEICRRCSAVNSISTD